MRSGKLRHKFKHQTQRKTGTDEHGQPVYRWDDVGTLWGSLNNLNTRTAESARQLYSQATHEIRVRYIPAGITINDRLIHNGVSYHVGHIGNPEARNRELILLVTSGA